MTYSRSPLELEKVAHPGADLTSQDPYRDDVLAPRLPSSVDLSRAGFIAIRDEEYAVSVEVVEPDSQSKAAKGLTSRNYHPTGLPESRHFRKYRRPKYPLAKATELRKGLTFLLETHSSEGGGGQPVRLRKFIQAFLDAGPQGATLDELEFLFVNTKKPRARVSETVTWVNNKLAELDVNLAIESETVYRVRQRP